ncbi:hypothetical protein FRC10_007918 [Ceratobasidium sp. 414]|nr:hypothetical protein FRC10_007918 [Ceratobasidium sp. 414]
MIRPRCSWNNTSTASTPMIFPGGCDTLKKPAPSGSKVVHTCRYMKLSVPGAWLAHLDALSPCILITYLETPPQIHSIRNTYYSRLLMLYPALLRPTTAPDPASNYRKGPCLHRWQGTRQIHKPLPSGDAAASLAATGTDANACKEASPHIYSAGPPHLVLEEEHCPLA